MSDKNASSVYVVRPLLQLLLLPAEWIEASAWHLSFCLSLHMHCEQILLILLKKATF